jgi:hypothetical protein
VRIGSGSCPLSIPADFQTRLQWNHSRFSSGAVGVAPSESGLTGNHMYEVMNVP